MFSAENKIKISLPTILMFYNILPFLFHAVPSDDHTVGDDACISYIFLDGSFHDVFRWVKICCIFISQ